MAKNWEHVAGTMWPVLVKAAAERRTLTYGELGEQPGVNIHHRNVGGGLEPILFFCQKRDLPPLTALVVSKGSGKPGAGLAARDDRGLEGDLEQIYGFPWQGIENPFGGYGPEDTSESFARTITKDPTLAEDVYRQVKCRGSAQRVFRLALLDAYGRQCAMCGLSFVEALDAAHITAWEKCEGSQRISLGNGILLCANHHKLFDSGLISVTEEYAIECTADSGQRSETDQQVCAALHGRRLHIPEREELRPDPELLRAHRNGG